MQAFDSGGLIVALRRAAGKADPARWIVPDNQFAGIAAISAALPQDCCTPFGSSAIVARTRDEFAAHLNRFKLESAAFDEEGMGIVTSLVEQIVLEPPGQMVRVRAEGGFHRLIVVPTREVQTYDFDHPLSPREKGVPMPMRFRRQSAACIPLRHGGNLWLAQMPAAGVGELFQRAKTIMRWAAKTQPSARWESVLVPVVQIVRKYRVSGLAGTMLDTEPPQKILDVFQVLQLAYNLNGMRYTSAPKADPDGQSHLAFNGPTLVFKAVGSRIQWLYHIKPADWETYEK